MGNIFYYWTCYPSVRMLAMFHFLPVSCWPVHKIRNESESIKCCFNSLLLSLKLLAIIQYQQANLLLLARLYDGEEPLATSSQTRAIQKWQHHCTIQHSKHGCYTTQ